MKKIQQTESKKKRAYSKPFVEQIKLDHEISMVMMSPPPHPGGSLPTDHFSINPFKLPKL